MSKPGPDSDLWAENFPVAAFRHWRDAQLLERENCVENADQLYGLTAECAIKKALVELPAFANSGKLHLDYKEHINVLWSRVKHQSLQKRYPDLLAFLKATNPFSDWDMEQRYAADSIVSSEAIQRHRNTAKRLLGAVGLTGQRK